MKDTHKLHNKLNLLTFILNYNTSIFFFFFLSKNGTISENKTIMETQGYVIVSRGRSPLTGRVCLSKISEKNPLKVPRSCVCRCGLNFFSPLRETSFNMTRGGGRMKILQLEAGNFSSPPH